ncbi:type II secretion system F family protein [Rubellicoccus peritrichatus]|uniref:Type II secretion system F family protein n=1 Tax=Rubellicoccus peritrichatus TaxID=3080537 RepID=A0AAQ3LAM2_9BACT|nr:type II secretion system F family protein [Puniceicoccus sp. CR14]WOO42171.1 type II secretion system F family protein [Puniceicoccus sp. CR14]
MPASHKTLANWYLQLSQSLEAGMTLAQSLESSGGPKAADRMAMSSQIQSGMPLDNVLKGAPNWLPKSDRIFISAAAQTGRLPQTLKNLAERHSRIGANKMKGILSLIYPLGIFHFAVFISPIMGMINFETGIAFNIGAYLGQVFAMLFPLWAVIGIVVFLVKTESPILPKLMRAIPVLRGYSKAQAVADFSYALGTFLDAGVNVKRSWQGAAAVAGDPDLKKATHELNATFDREEDPVPQLKRLKCFPTNFVSLYQAGAMSGQLDQNLLIIGRQYQAKANNLMTLTAVVYPTILFVIVVGYVIFTILTMYAGYLDALTGIMDG